MRFIWLSFSSFFSKNYNGKLFKFLNQNKKNSSIKIYSLIVCPNEFVNQYRSSYDPKLESIDRTESILKQNTLVIIIKNHQHDRFISDLKQLKSNIIDLNLGVGFFFCFFFLNIHLRSRYHSFHIFSYQNNILLIRASL